MRPQPPQERAGRDDANTFSVVHRRALRLGQAATLVVIASAFAGWAGWSLAPSREPSGPRVVTRFAVQAPAGTVIDAFDMSPDGTALTYVGRSRDAIRLFIRRLDQFRDSPISGSEGASSPLFSPDGQWVAFFSGRRLLKVSVQTNAAPILISENIERWLNGATWLADGSIVFARANSGLHRVSAEGGEPVRLTSLSETPREFDHHSPTLLPGDKALLFTVHAQDGRFNVVVETLATAERKLLIESAYDARYVASGHLVFARDEAILAVPFDLQRLEVTGPPVTLVEPVAGKPLDGNGGYRLSTNGTLAFLPQPSLDGRTLTWVERTGAETPLPIPARAFSSPRVSPDGTRLAFAVAEAGRHDIYTYELATGTLARLTRDGDNRAPIWTRDGQHVTYSSSSSSTSTPSTRGDARRLVLQSVDGRAPEGLISGGISLVPGTWSANGHVLVYTDGSTALQAQEYSRCHWTRTTSRNSWSTGRERSWSPASRLMVGGSRSLRRKAVDTRCTSRPFRTRAYAIKLLSRGDARRSGVAMAASLCTGLADGCSPCLWTRHGGSRQASHECSSTRAATSSAHPADQVCLGSMTTWHGTADS